MPRIKYTADILVFHLGDELEWPGSRGICRASSIGTQIGIDICDIRAGWIEYAANDQKTKSCGSCGPISDTPNCREQPVLLPPKIISKKRHHGSSWKFPASKCLQRIKRKVGSPEFVRHLKTLWSTTNCLLLFFARHGKGRLPHVFSYEKISLYGGFHSHGGTPK